MEESYPISDLDNATVGWDSQNDPENPRNFTSLQKFLNLGLVSFISFLSSLASSIPSPGLDSIKSEFGVSSHVLGSFSVSIYVLGLAAGPLILSPLSENYGRRIVLDFANVWLTVWQLACALAPNLKSLVAFRFLAGVGGSASITIGGGIISDLFLINQRGLANSVFTIGPLFGPVLGPILGGFIAQRAGWRWIFWVLLAACGLSTVGVFVLGRETNHIVLLRHKTGKLRKLLNRADLVCASDNQTVSPHQNITSITTTIAKPIHFATTSPLVPLLAIYMSFVFGLLYLLLTTVTNVFKETYGWSIELCGLAYLGLGLGFAVGLFVVAQTSDANVARLTKGNNNEYKPEMRLASCVYFALFVPLSFFWYGWSTETRAHWIVPILGLAPFGFGMMGIFAPVQTYVIDIAGHHTASVLAAITTMRCIFGTFLPLAGPPMYSSLGLGWGNSLLGFIALCLIPAPVLIYRNGAALRQKYPLKAS